MKHPWQTVFMLIGCMVILWLCWTSLAADVKSGKPFQLDNKWYQAVEVNKP